MTDSCRIFDTEYKHQFTKKSQTPTHLFVHSDCFADRIEEDWQIDPRLASIPTKFDEAAEKLVYKQILDNNRTIYQVCYKDPWSAHSDEDEKTDDESKKSSKGRKSKEANFQSELFAYIRNLYFNPHDEKVLAPPVTGKRVFGYSRPKDLHGSLSMYQDTHGRTGSSIMLRNAEFSTTAKERELRKDKDSEEEDEKKKGKEVDFCTSFKE